MRWTSWLAIAVFVVLGGLIIPWNVAALNNYLGLPRVASPLLQGAGFILIVSGLAVTGYCKRVFRIVGKGTPVPIEPPKAFVVVGLYQYTRNPMYVSYVGIWLGVFFVFGHLLLLVHCVAWWFLWEAWIVFVEEPGLRRRFGKPYEVYLKRVPRWLGKVKGEVLP